MEVEYLSCNILTENDSLLEQINDQSNALIWWSNAFFSVYSNWMYSTEQRHEFYCEWINKLGRKAPRLLLYGSDYQNVGVNFYPAGQYRAWLQHELAQGPDDLNPPRLHRYQMRY